MYGTLSFVSPCAVLIEESPQKNSFPPVHPNSIALWRPRVYKVGDGVDLGLGGDVGGAISSDLYRPQSQDEIF